MRSVVQCMTIGSEHMLLLKMGSMHTQKFANPSSKHEWKEQGDYFKQREMYAQALHCYKKTDETHLQKEMEAYIIMSDGLVSTEHRLTDAAVLLLESDELCNDQKHISKAAEWLEQAMKYKEAALLYEKLGKVCYITLRYYFIAVLLCIF